MKNLIQWVVEQVAPSAFYLSIFEGVKWGQSEEARVKCCFHSDNTPSLHLNQKTGAWYCHGCALGGRTIVAFLATHDKIEHQAAAEQIYHTFIRPVVPRSHVDKLHKALMGAPTVIKYLTNTRFISLPVIKQYRLGWTGSRIAIPLFDPFGLCVNVKYYDPLHKKHGAPKMLNHAIESESRKFGTPPVLYPFNQLELARKSSDQFIAVEEGELDALATISTGMPCVTSTAGCKSWPVDIDEHFAGLNVVVCYDNDEDGRKFRAIPIKRISKFSRTTRVIECPEDLGKETGEASKDATDWIKFDVTMRRREGWVAAFYAVEPTTDNPHREGSEPDDLIEVSLDGASHASTHGMKIAVKAIVTGKDTAPYLLPKKFRVSCARTCEACPLSEGDRDFLEHTIPTNSPEVLSLIDQPKPILNRALIGMRGFPNKPECACKLEIVEVFNLESLLLIPTLDSAQSEHVRRAAFFVGHGLKSNRAYEFRGLTTPHPKDQHSTHLFAEALPVQDAIETFTLTPQLCQELRVFRPRVGQSLIEHLRLIAHWMSFTVTKIRERDDLHILVDLVFHSVAGFNFNYEAVNRGMLDLLVLGDTRCGKGKVTESLVRFYGLGDVASGENCTFAGLIGGLQQAGTRWFVTWGLIPLNNGRLVVIDEASALTHQEIGHMSRVRSEGVAEISKIVREATNANTRLVWLSNVRSGRPIATYNTGVEAIKELIGANEDISRFDLALTVATNEVSSSVINTLATEHQPPSLDFTQHQCRSLVLWAWSRTKDQIVFSNAAVEKIIEVAIRLGEKYSPVIPLIQGENVRIKVAKIAAAIAARTFSASEDGQKLIIRGYHVACAEELINMAYTKPSMAYDRYSHVTKRSSTLDEVSVLDRIFAPLGADRNAVIMGISTMHQVTAEGVADYVGGDINVAKILISDLVKARALIKIDRVHWYLKNPEFNTWLRSKM